MREGSRGSRWSAALGGCIRVQRRRASAPPTAAPNFSAGALGTTHPFPSSEQRHHSAVRLSCSSTLRWRGRFCAGKEQRRRTPRDCAGRGSPGERAPSLPFAVWRRRPRAALLACTGALVPGRVGAEASRGRLSRAKARAGSGARIEAGSHWIADSTIRDALRSNCSGAVKFAGAGRSARKCPPRRGGCDVTIERRGRCRQSGSRASPPSSRLFGPRLSGARAGS